MKLGNVVYFKKRNEDYVTPGIVIKVNELEIRVQYIEFNESLIIQENRNKPLNYREKYYTNRQIDISILDIKNKLIDLYEVDSVNLRPVTLEEKDE